MSDQIVIFCGGGSGGHVLPALTLIRALRETRPQLKIQSIGSYQGIEATLFPELQVPYKSISTGKLRRYLSLQNFIDIFKLFFGTLQSFCFLLKFSRKNTLIFSTGGFVTVPVVFAAWLQRKKIIIHEQTTRIGLANKIGSIFADDILVTFKDSLNYLPREKSQLVGYPFRNEIFQKVDKAVLIDGEGFFEQGRPILFLTGGGNGSLLLNEALSNILPQLKDRFFIIHQCGKAHYEKYKKLETAHYKVFDFVGEEMIPLLRKSEVIISRAGAGTVMELIALGRPSIFIPLKIAQKNEQYHNAKAAEVALGSIVIEENELSEESLLNAVESILSKPKKDIITENPTVKIIDKIMLRLGNRE